MTHLFSPRLLAFPFFLPASAKEKAVRRTMRATTLAVKVRRIFCGQISAAPVCSFQFT